MEHRALGIISKKIVAAQLLYGDDVSAAFAEDQGGSLLEELGKEAASATKIPNLRDLFRRADENAFEMEQEDDEIAPSTDHEAIIVKPPRSRPIQTGDMIQLSLF